MLSYSEFTLAHSSVEERSHSSTMVQTTSEAKEPTPPTHHLFLGAHSLPIARLFPEILLEIFFHCAHSGGKLSIPSQLIRITHVCHYWRTLAISCPSLWAVISIPSRCTHTFVERSRNVPLTLRCSLDSDTSSSQLECVLNSNRFRTKHLDLRGPRRMLGPVVEKGLGECCLSSLSIVNTTTDNTDDEGIDDESTDDENPDDEGTDDEGGFWLPDSPFVAHISSKPMCLLELKACGFQWDSPLYTSGLTTLHLINIAKPQRPSASRLFEILSALPGLKDLALVRAAPLDLRQSFGRLVPLRQLARLRIEDRGPTCALLLSRLDACASVTLAIVCSKGAETEEINVTGIILASAQRCIPGLTYSCLGLVVEKGALKFSLDTVGGRYLTIVFQKTNYWQPERLSQIITLARGLFFVEDISELHLGGKARSSPYKPKTSLLIEARTHWQTLSTFGKLHTIRLNGCRPMMLLEILLEQAMLCIGISILPSTRHIQPDGTSRQFIKDLHSIHFHDFNFDEEVIARGQVDFFDLLTAFLWALRRGRSRTPHIYIHHGCAGITNSRVSQLRKYADVTWESRHCSVSGGATTGDDFQPVMETFTQLSALHHLGEISETIL